MLFNYGLPFSLRGSISIYLSIDLCTHVSTYLSVNPSIPLSMYPSTHLSIHIFTHLPVYLSVCMELIYVPRSRVVSFISDGLTHFSFLSLENSLCLEGRLAATYGCYRADCFRSPSQRSPLLPRLPSSHYSSSPTA